MKAGTRSKYIATLILLLGCILYGPGKGEEADTLTNQAPTLDQQANELARRAEEGSEFIDETPTLDEEDRNPPNLLFIVLDQLKYDAIEIVQDMMGRYDGKLKVRTPNINALARSGALFKTAYCASPSCAPSRACLRTGTTLQRAAIKGNKMVKASVWKLMDSVRNKVHSLQTFEQVLADHYNYTIGKTSFRTRSFTLSPQSNCLSFNILFC